MKKKFWYSILHTMRHEHVNCCEGRIWQESQDRFVLILLGQGIIGQMSLRSLHCKNILVFSYILRHIMPLYSNFSIRVQFIKLTIFWYLGVLRSKVTGSCCKNMGFFGYYLTQWLWDMGGPCTKSIGIKIIPYPTGLEKCTVLTLNLAKIY